MALEAQDRADIADMIKNGVTAGLRACMPPLASSRTAAETGSPEFAEDRTQVNSLNNKFIFSTEISAFWKMFLQSTDHGKDVDSRNLRGLDQLLDLQSKVNDKFFTAVDDRARLRDQWNYITAYDLSDPNTLGTSDVVRGGVVPQNRAIDTATVQAAFNSNTFQAAIQAAVADAINGTIPDLEAAIGDAVAAAVKANLQPVAPPAAPAAA